MEKTAERQWSKVIDTKQSSVTAKTPSVAPSKVPSKVPSKTPSSSSKVPSKAPSKTPSKTPSIPPKVQSTAPKAASVAPSVTPKPLSTIPEDKSVGVAPVAPAPVAKAVRSPTFQEKVTKTYNQAQKVGCLIMESRLLVAILVFFMTMIMLLILNPPMAQELGEDGIESRRSWKKIMVWSTLALVLAILLPLTCK